MDPKLQFLFFLAAIVCWFMATFFENHPPGMTTIRYATLGWLFFGIPFAWNAALAGW